MHTAFLADHPEHVATLAEWFKAEWSGYYAGRSLDDIAAELSADLNYHRLPVRLVAFDDGKLAGCIVLREEIVPDQPEYHPGLGGLYVHPPFRRQGLGTALVQAGMHLAHSLGYAVIYTTTNTASGIVEQLGWERLGTVTNHGETIGLYRYYTSG